MKVFLSIALFVLCSTGYSQSVLSYRADTVRFYKQGGSAELLLQNSTKDTLGILVNVGGGKTRFLKPHKINDTSLVVGLDTFSLGSGGGLTSVTADSITIVGTGTALQPLTAIGVEPKFSTISALRLASTLSLNTYTSTTGFYAANDGGGARYFITPDTIAGLPVDSVSFIKLGTGKYARMVHTGTILLDQFGAVGNGTADDLRAFTKLINFARKDRSVSIALGTNGKVYNLTLRSTDPDAMMIKIDFSGFTLDGNGAKILYNNNASQSYVYYNNGTTLNIYRAKESHTSSGGNAPQDALSYTNQNWQLVQTGVTFTGLYPMWSSAGVQYNGAHYLLTVGTFSAFYTDGVTPITRNFDFKNWEIYTTESDAISQNGGYWNVRAKPIATLDGVDNITYDNLKIHNILSEFIYGEGSHSVKRVHINNCELYFGSNGVSANGELLVENTKIHHMAFNAVECALNGDKQTYLNNTIDNCVNGFTITGGGGTGGSGNTLSDVNIRGNRIFNCSSSGLLLTRKARGIVVDNNIFYDNTTSITVAMQSDDFPDAMSEIRITNNTIGSLLTNGGVGIYLSAVNSADTVISNLLIQGNIFTTLEISHIIGLNYKLDVCIFFYGSRYKNVAIKDNTMFFTGINFITKDATASAVVPVLSNNIISGGAETHKIKVDSLNIPLLGGGGDQMLYVDNIGAVKAQAIPSGGGSSQWTTSDSGIYRNSRVGIGTVNVGANNIPNQAVAMAEVVSNNNVNRHLLSFKTYGVGSPSIEVYRASGSEASPTPSLSGDKAISWGFRFYNSSGPEQSSAADIVSASENHTTTAQGTERQFEVTPNGTNNRVVSLKLNNDGATSHWGRIDIVSNSGTPAYLRNVISGNAYGVFGTSQAVNQFTYGSRVGDLVIRSGRDIDPRNMIFSVNGDSVAMKLDSLRGLVLPGYAGSGTAGLSIDSVGRLVRGGVGGSTQWSTSGSDIYYNTGNVGIGESSPSNKLTVKTSSSGGILVNAASGYPYVAFQNNGITNGLFGGAAATNNIIIGSAGGDFAIRAESGNILFSTNAGSSLAGRVNSSGKLIFGSTTPVNMQGWEKILATTTSANTFDAGIGVHIGGKFVGNYMDTVHGVYKFDGIDYGAGTVGLPIQIGGWGGKVSLDATVKIKSPATGSSGDSVLVRNGTDSSIRMVAQSSLGGGGGGTVNHVFQGQGIQDIRAISNDSIYHKTFVDGVNSLAVNQGDTAIRYDFYLPRDTVQIKHLVAIGTAPTAAIQSAAGTGASASIGWGKDMAFVVQVNTGTSPTTGEIVRITPGTAFHGANPIVACSMPVSYFKDFICYYTSGAIRIEVNTALAASTNYQFQIIVIDY